MPIQNNTRLTIPMQKRLEDLVTTYGTNGAAKRLQTSPSAVDRLMYGGVATARLVQHVTSALEALRAAAS